MKNWLYYNVDKEEYKSCAERLALHNLVCIARITLCVGILFTGIGLYICFRSDGGKRPIFAYFTVALLQYAISLFTSAPGTVHRHKPIVVTIAFCFAFLSLVLFDLFVLIYDASDSLAMEVVVFFISLQIPFAMNRLLSALANIFVVMAFLILFIFFPSTKVEFSTVLTIMMACIIAIVCNRLVVQRLISEIIISHAYDEERNRFYQESIHDALTGLSNRRHFDQSVDFYLSVCRRVHQTVCVIMMDIDFFKRYNDHYGHAKGDEVLRAVGGVLKRLIDEESVFAARVGGEEFIVLWTENRVSEAERVTRELRNYINGLRIPHVENDAAPYITASLGLYIMRGGSQDSGVEMYNNADKALYQAKQRGRNRIVLLDSHNKQVFRDVALDVAKKDEGRR